MTVVSSTEFKTYQDKYLDMAVNEQVAIKKGETMFYIVCKPPQRTSVPTQVALSPDDDLRRAITFDELLEKTYEDIDEFFVNK